MNSLKVLFVVMLVMVISACSDSSGGGDGKSLHGQGVVTGFGGKMKGADVSIGGNTVKTNSGGEFFDLLIVDGSIFVKGGTDSLNNYLGSVTLSAPQEIFQSLSDSEREIFINALTSFMNYGATQESVKLAFGLEDDFISENPSDNITLSVACAKGYFLNKALGLRAYGTSSAKEGAIFEEVARFMNGIVGKFTKNDILSLIDRCTNRYDMGEDIDYNNDVLASVIMNFLDTADAISRDGGDNAFNRLRLWQKDAYAFLGLLINYEDNVEQIIEDYDGEGSINVDEGVNDTVAIMNVLYNDELCTSGIEILTGETLNFAGDDSHNANTFSWQVLLAEVEVASSNESTVDNAFIEAGVYTVVLTVTNSEDDSDSTEFTVIVNNPPLMAVIMAEIDGRELASGVEVYLNETISFDNLNSLGFESHIWTLFSQPANSEISIDDETVDTLDITPIVPGNYELRLTVEKDDEVAVAIFTFTAVEFLAEAGDNIEEDFTGHGSVQVSCAASKGFVSQTWEVLESPGGESIDNADAVNATLNYTQRGSYVLQVTVVNKYGDELTDTVTINVRDIGTGGSEPIYDDPLIELLSATEDSEKPGLFHYRLAFQGKLSAVAPFINTRFNNYVSANFTEIDEDQYILEIARYNGTLLKCSYGHDLNTYEYANITLSTNFYNSTSNELELMFYEGKIYSLSDAPEIKPEDAPVDAIKDVLMYAWIDPVKETLELRPYLSESYVSQLNPFYYESGAPAITDMEATKMGFGKISVPIGPDLTGQFIFTYGGDSVLGAWVLNRGLFFYDDGQDTKLSVTVVNGHILIDRGLEWPVQGPVLAGFEDPNYEFIPQLGEHTGIDIGVPQGTPVDVSNDGVVIAVNTDFYTGASVGYTYITVQHANGLTTRYGHMFEVHVSVGDFVAQGDVIGLSGGAVGVQGSGPYTSGAHVHFEVRIYDAPVNPEDYLVLE